MRIAFTLVILATLSSCATEQKNGSENQPTGKVQERKIVSTTTERSVGRPQIPIRERSLSSQSFPETVLKPVYEHLVVLEDGRTVRVQSTNPGYPAGSCVRVSEGSSSEPSRMSASSSCK